MIIKNHPGYIYIQLSNKYVLLFHHGYISKLLHQDGNMFFLGKQSNNPVNNSFQLNRHGTDLTPRAALISSFPFAHLQFFVGTDPWESPEISMEHSMKFPEKTPSKTHEHLIEFPLKAP